MINIGNGAVQVYLSSAAKEDPKSDDTILIGPPFYLELKLGGFSLPVQVNHTPNNSINKNTQVCQPDARYLPGKPTI